MSLEISFSFYEPNFGESINFPEGKCVWLGREMRELSNHEIELSKLLNLDAMFVPGQTSSRPLMAKGEASGKAGYSEEKGFFVEVQFKLDFDDSGDKKNDRAGEAKDQSDSTERPDSSERGSDSSPKGDK